VVGCAGTRAGAYARWSSERHHARDRPAGR
jgi:hypothetical protein